MYGGRPTHLSQTPSTPASMAETGKILKGKYPAKAHAAKVVAYLKSKDPSVHGIIYLESQKTRMIEDNDEPVPFRSVIYLPHSSILPLLFGTQSAPHEHRQYIQIY